MKPIIFILIVFSTIRGMGQAPVKAQNETNAAQSNNPAKNEIRVEYRQKQKASPIETFLINGKEVTKSLINTLNPDLVEDVSKVDNVFHITTKQGYFPDIITLNDLRKKYTDVVEKSVVYMIDNYLIKESADLYELDENYIQKVVIEEVGVVSEKQSTQVINIFTKRNWRSGNNSGIMIRGVDHSVGR